MLSTQLLIYFVEDSRTTCKVSLSKDCLESQWKSCTILRLQFREETFEEGQSIGIGGCYFILSLFFQVEEAALVQKLTPFCSQLQSLLTPVKFVFQVVCWILSEVLQQCLAVSILQIHVFSQFFIADVSCFAEQKMQQSEDRYFPAISILDMGFTIIELDCCVVDRIRDLNCFFLNELSLHISYDLLYNCKSHLQEQHNMNNSSLNSVFSNSSASRSLICLFVLSRQITNSLNHDIWSMVASWAALPLPVCQLATTTPNSHNCILLVDDSQEKCS